MVQDLLERISAVVVEVRCGAADAAQARHIELVPVISGRRRWWWQDKTGQKRAARIGTAACDGRVPIGLREQIGAYVAGQAAWTSFEHEAWRRAWIYRPRTSGADVVVADSRWLRRGLPRTGMTLTTGA